MSRIRAFPALLLAIALLTFAALSASTAGALTIAAPGAAHAGAIFLRTPALAAVSSRCCSTGRQ